MVAGGNLESFLKKDLKEEESPKDGAKSGIDNNKILASSDISAESQPEICE
jgi:hypothetical protein